MEDKTVSWLSLVTGEQRTLVEGTFPRLAGTGQLLFGRRDSLWGVAFDSERVEIVGTPRTLVQDLQVNTPGGWAYYAAGDDGTLVYLPASSYRSTLVWVDREGHEETIPGLPPQVYGPVDVAPDGSRFVVAADQAGNYDLWTYDIARATLSRLTTDNGTETSPLWRPDGERIAYMGSSDNVGGLFSTSWNDFSGATAILLDPELVAGISTLRLPSPRAWVSDGTLVFDQLINGDYDVLVASSDEDQPPQVLLGSEFNELHATLSPDGQWIAYASDQTGSYQVYVDRFPELGDRQQISADGGREPLWATDGRELFYRSLSATAFITVPVQIGPTLTAGTPTTLFGGELSAAAGRIQHLGPHLRP